MKSELDDEFIALFAKLPERIQRLARKNYRVWVEDTQHPSLEFKRVGVKSAVYSVRVGIGWRALGVLEEDTITWFWIGSHADYDGILRRMR